MMNRYHTVLPGWYTCEQGSGTEALVDDVTLINLWLRDKRWESMEKLAHL